MKRVNQPVGSEKKAYETPFLKQLGDVKELTQGIKGSAVTDSENFEDFED